MIGKTPAQAAVNGSGIQNRYGPDHEIVWATTEHAIYNDDVSRLDGRTSLMFR